MFGRKIFVLSGDHFAFFVIHQVEGLRDSEVGQLHVALVGDHDVFRSDIAMHDVEWASFAIALLMRVSEPTCDTGNDEGGQIYRDRAIKLLMLFQELLEIHATNKLHHHEVLASETSEMIGLNDTSVN